jgi:NAD(P)-dependent dehydrogenase (short-subunit alcohol dehydrogenase family)
VLARWNRLDGLVNCAGIATATPVAELTLAEWRRVHAVNLDGVFLGTRAAIRAMQESGGGSIVNVASLSGIETFPGAAAYASSKAAVIQFSRVAAAECAQAGKGIRVNVVAPGGVKTPMWRSLPSWRTSPRRMKSGVEPRPEMFLGREIARAIVGLQDEASGRSREVLVLTGRR